MRIDFNIALKDLDGKDITEASGPEAIQRALLEGGVSAMLLGRAMQALTPFFNTGEAPARVVLTAARACANALQADQEAKGADKVDRIRLAIKLMDPKQPVELSEREKDTILKCTDKAYGALIYARVYDLLNAEGA